MKRGTEGYDAEVGGQAVPALHRVSGPDEPSNHRLQCVVSAFSSDHVVNRLKLDRRAVPTHK